MKNAKYTAKYLIDRGAEISIFKENAVTKYLECFPENLTMQGFTDQKLLETKSTLTPCKISILKHYPTHCRR